MSKSLKLFKKIYTFVISNFLHMCKSFKSLVLTALLLIISFPVSAQLPSIQLKDLNGKSVNMAELSNDGKPFVISMFASWCKPCLRELRAIADLYPDWQDETGMKMYIVSIDEAQNVSKVKPLVKSEGWDYEVLLDTNSDFFRSMCLASVPHVFIVDGKGKVVYSHSGYTDGSETEIIKKIRELND